MIITGMCAEWEEEEKKSKSSPELNRDGNIRGWLITQAPIVIFRIRLAVSINLRTNLKSAKFKFVFYHLFSYCYYPPSSFSFLRQLPFWIHHEMSERFPFVCKNFRGKDFFPVLFPFRKKKKKNKKIENFFKNLLKNFKFFWC